MILIDRRTPTRARRRTVYMEQVTDRTGVEAGLLDHGELEVALHNQLAVDVALALHLDQAELGLEGGQLHLHDQGVTRDDRAAPLDVVHARKEEITLAVRDGLLQAHHA